MAKAKNNRPLGIDFWSDLSDCSRKTAWAGETWNIGSFLHRIEKHYGS